VHIYETDADVPFEKFPDIIDKFSRIEEEEEQIVVELTKNPGYKEPLPKKQEMRAPPTGIVQTENQYKTDTVRDRDENVSLGRNSGAIYQRDEIPRAYLKRIRVPSHSRLPTAKTHKSKSSTSLGRPNAKSRSHS
jgi:hypothetical protein